MQMPSLKVLTYNIHKGFTSGNRKYILSSIRDAIRELDVDVAALQEVTGENKKHARRRSDWHHEGQFEFLADQTWPHYAYGKNAIYQSGHHGNALLSKFPFQSINNQDISQSRYSRRSILHAPITLPGVNWQIHLSCVHLGFLPYEQFLQWRCLDQWLQSLAPETPVILMGDFNDWHQRIHRKLVVKHHLCEAVEQHYGKLQPTYPSNRPRLSVDRIYYRGLSLRSTELHNSNRWGDLSDHCPIVAEFTL